MRGAATTALIITLLAGGAPGTANAARPSAERLLKMATKADADLRAQPNKLRYRHHIERLLRRWSRAVRASDDQPALYRAAVQGQASAWALMAHWSGRRDDHRQAQAAAAHLAQLKAVPVQDAPLARSGERSVLAGDITPPSPVPAPAVPEVEHAQADHVHAEHADAEHAEMDAQTLAVALRTSLDKISREVGTPGSTPELELRASTREAVKPRTLPLLAIRKVVIDAGHGGHDHGAVGPKGVREADVNLAIAKRLGTELAQTHGLEVVYTRTTDDFISLPRRSEIANEQRADLFISVHANAHRNKRVHGVETYYLNTTSNRYALRLARRENQLAEDDLDAHVEPEVGMQPEPVPTLPKGQLGQDLRLILADMAMRSASAESRRLAGYIQTSVVGRLQRTPQKVKDLGVKHALFYVLLGARMPAVLVETGFISHAEESQRLIDAAYQDKVATAIAKGVMRFAQEREALAARLKSPDSLAPGALASHDAAPIAP